MKKSKYLPSIYSFSFSSCFLICEFERHGKAYLMIKFIAGTVIVKHFVLSGCLLYISWVNLRVAPINPQGAHYLSDCSSIACVEVDRDLWAPHARYLKSKNTFIWLWERCNFSSTSLQAAAKLLFLVGQHLKLIPTQHAIPT